MCAKKNINMIDILLTIAVIILTALTLNLEMKKQMEKQIEKEIKKAGAKIRHDRKMKGVLLTLCVALLMWVFTLGYVFFTIHKPVTAWISWGSVVISTVILWRLFKKSKDLSE